MNAQTAEVFFRKSHIAPVPANMARTFDFGTIFGKEPQHCALVAAHDNRTWVRLVGRNINLRLWNKPDPNPEQSPVLNLPQPIATPFFARHWTGFHSIECLFV